MKLKNFCFTVFVLIGIFITTAQASSGLYIGNSILTEQYCRAPHWASNPPASWDQQAVNYACGKARAACVVAEANNPKWTKTGFHCAYVSHELIFRGTAVCDNNLTAGTNDGLIAMVNMNCTVMAYPGPANQVTIGDQYPTR